MLYPLPYRHYIIFGSMLQAQHKPPLFYRML